MFAWAAMALFVKNAPCMNCSDPDAGAFIRLTIA